MNKDNKENALKEDATSASKMIKLPLEQVKKLRALTAYFNNFLMTQSFRGDDVLVAAELMKEATKTCKELNEKIGTDS